MPARTLSTRRQPERSRSSTACVSAGVELAPVIAATPLRARQRVERGKGGDEIARVRQVEIVRAGFDHGAGEAQIGALERPRGVDHQIGLERANVVRRRGVAIQHRRFRGADLQRGAIGAFRRPPGHDDPCAETSRAALPPGAGQTRPPRRRSAHALMAARSRMRAPSAGSPAQHRSRRPNSGSDCGRCDHRASCAGARRQARATPLQPQPGSADRIDSAVSDLKNTRPSITARLVCGCSGVDAEPRREGSAILRLNCHELEAAGAHRARARTCAQREQRTQSPSNRIRSCVRSGAATASQRMRQP